MRSETHPTDGLARDRAGLPPGRELAGGPEYIYDVFNRRVGRKIDTSAPFDMANAVFERHVLDDVHNGLTSADGGNVVLDFVDTDGSGAQAIAVSKRYLYGEAVDQLFAQEDLAKTLGDTSCNLWPLVDHLGTVRDLAKQDGTIAAHYRYDSFEGVRRRASFNAQRPPRCADVIPRGTLCQPSRPQSEALKPAPSYCLGASHGRSDLPFGIRPSTTCCVER